MVNRFVQPLFIAGLAELRQAKQTEQDESTMMKSQIISRPLVKPLIVALALAMVVPALPVLAQSTTDAAAEARLRKLEAEMRALQRVVFPGGDGKFFPPQVTATGAATAAGTPATTPVADMLTRMESLETQLSRLTAQTELNTNKLAQLEAQVAVLRAGATPAATPTPTPTATLTPAATPSPRPSATPTPRPTAASGPSAARLAAVRAVQKPATDDPGDDEYSYGFRLWEAKFQPEAQQQLKLFLDKYPRHSRVSYARNLLGRSLLDEGKPREAATWFLQNYQNNKAGERAPDSLLFLAESMRLLKDTQRACVALSQFANEYPREAAGRLKAQYDSTRAGVTCN
jgi:TolA-binding protein